jgi:hypothetical protein
MPKDFEAFVTERLESSLKILETPAAALKMMRHEKNNNGNNGNTPSYLYEGWSTETNRS